MGRGVSLRKIRQTRLREAGLNHMEAGQLPRSAAIHHESDEVREKRDAYARDERVRQRVQLIRQLRALDEQDDEHAFQLDDLDDVESTEQS